MGLWGNFCKVKKIEKYKNIQVCTRKQTLQFPEKWTFEIIQISAQGTLTEGESVSTFPSLTTLSHLTAPQVPYQQWIISKSMAVTCSSALVIRRLNRQDIYKHTRTHARFHSVSIYSNSFLFSCHTVFHIYMQKMCNMQLVLSHQNTA